MEEVLDKGPFFHGTKANLAIGEFLEPKHESNFEEKRISKIKHFSWKHQTHILGLQNLIFELKSSFSGF